MYGFGNHQSRVDGKSQLFGHIPSERSLEAIGKSVHLHYIVGTSTSTCFRERARSRKWRF